MTILSLPTLCIHLQKYGTYVGVYNVSRTQSKQARRRIRNLIIKTIICHILRVSFGVKKLEC